MGKFSWISHEKYHIKTRYIFTLNTFQGKRSRTTHQSEEYKNYWGFEYSYSIRNKSSSYSFSKSIECKKSSQNISWTAGKNLDGIYKLHVNNWSNNAVTDDCKLSYSHVFGPSTPIKSTFYSHSKVIPLFCTVCRLYPLGLFFEYATFG